MKIWLMPLWATLIILNSCKSDNPGNIEKVVLAETIKSWNGTTLPNYPEGQPKISILKITIPPKTTLGRHIHPVINAGVLLKGELTVVDEYDNVLKLKAGDPIVELVNTIHYGKNEGNEPAEIIVFYAGTEESAITVITTESDKKEL
jgi:quercetin dioxygenase-like cupin family protein